MTLLGMEVYPLRGLFSSHSPFMRIPLSKEQVREPWVGDKVRFNDENTLFTVIHDYRGDFVLLQSGHMKRICHKSALQPVVSGDGFMLFEWQDKESRLYKLHV